MDLWDTGPQNDADLWAPAVKPRGRNQSNKPPPSSYDQQYGSKEKPLPEKKERPITPGKDADLDAGMNDDNPTWRWLLVDYTQNASLHGVRYITEKARFILRQVLWLLFVLGCFGFFTYYAYDRIAFYLKYTKNVNVEVNYLSKLKFPAVTVCNQNAFKITDVAKNDWYPLVQALLSNNGSSTPRQCLTSEFTCANKECVVLSVRCDLFPDCTDGSDEQGCVACPLLKVDHNNTADLLAAQPLVVGELFELQSDTYSSARPFYMARNITSPTYLYYDDAGGEWRFGQLYGAKKTYMKVVNSAANPQHINTTWQIDIAGTFEARTEITLKCTEDNTELLEQVKVVIPQDLSLERLFNEPSHKQEDFIQTCKWKGKDCLADAIAPKWTDMGKCYTFNNKEDMFIEQSGPGYGLILTMNIEYYEYTKGAEDGLGIKLLMHEPDDVPLVQERGVSVSPGLYSFISVETTQVKNLEPEWGTCGKQDLVYYTDYSIARCKMECETEKLAKDCLCRDFFMPEKNAQPPVCTVGVYMDCSKTTLDEMRAAGNYCYPDCPTPCEQDNYVPTTSFSVVLGPDTGSTVLDEKSLQLRNRLFNAREVTYRVVREKWLSTMRAFHILEQQLARMNRYLLATMENLVEEYNSVSALTSKVTTDCIWIRDIIEQVQGGLENYVITPMESVREAINIKLSIPARELSILVNESWFDIKANRYDNQYYKDVTVDLWSRRETMIKAIDEIRDVDLSKVRTNYFNDFLAISNIDHFRLHETYLTPLMNYIGSSCPAKCMDSSSSTFKDIISTDKKQFANKADWKSQDGITRTKEEVNSLFNRYLDDDDDDGIAWIFSITGSSSDAWRNLTNYRNAIFGIRTDLKNLVTNLDERLVEIRKKHAFLGELHGYMWSQNCETVMGGAFGSYKDGHWIINSLLEEMDQFISSQRAKLISEQALYKSENITLEEFGSKYAFDEIVDDVQMKLTTLLSAFNDRILLADKLKAQFSAINYLLLALIDESTLKTTSQYWKHFSLTSATPVLPSGTNPTPDFGIQSSAQEDKMWEDIKDNLKNLKGYLQTQVTGLVRHVKEAQTYFKTYVDGNQLSQDFYAQNFLQLDLHYKELTERKVSQQKAYEWSNLLSEIGGLMGLLLGASVLSLLEIFDLFIYNSFRKCCRSQVHPQKQHAWQ